VNDPQPHPGRAGRLRRSFNLFAVIREAGVGYTVKYCVRLAVRAGQLVSAKLAARFLAALEDIDSSLIDIERRQGLYKPWTIGSRRFTAADNRQWWNSHDWSKLGEEWTPDAAWKTGIVERFLRPYIGEGSVVEIGPGGGRWTELLCARAARVYVLDVAEAPLRVCRERFAQRSTISYVRGDGRTIPLREDSIDAVWSYDVFVHVNPADARSYIAEIGRVLRDGAYAVIHHPGQDPAAERAQKHRSDLTDQMVIQFAEASGLEVVLKTRELVNEGDVLTVLRRAVRPGTRAVP
jgi:SAM-dependent methyltransferase